MSRFVKKTTKEITDVGSGAMKKAFSAILGDIIKDILEETGATNIAKDKMMTAGYKVIKDLGVEPKNIQRDIIKSAIKSELKLK
ncbi:MAG: hypothetical protein GPJ54_11755 [Candidatus Heimdallarchaeota archaeon]|nr:hypothetical protein [Candidatus Heimdallarchaeota archaeon]